MSGPSLGIERLDAEGKRTLRLSGTLRFQQALAIWSQLRAETLDPPAGGIEFDLAQVEQVDGGVAALLVELRGSVIAAGSSAEFVGFNRDVQEILDLYGCLDGCERPPPGQISVLTQVGRATSELLAEGKRALAFVGAVTLSCLNAIRRPTTVSWSQTWPVLERAGADALPIVLMIGFLVGFIMAFQGAVQLEQFGASIFVADLVALTVCRELGPLMTAIVICGRSGAAFAAELGTMRVSEEIDALETLGVSPLGHLVLPRALALLIAVPILTLLADLMGLTGGLLVGLFSLDLTPVAYLNRTNEALELWDVASGVLKSFAFALTIALVSCQQGLATTGGAAGVGLSTTRAVVAILFQLIVIDAVFAIAFNALGL